MDVFLGILAWAVGVTLSVLVALWIIRQFAFTSRIAGVQPSATPAVSRLRV